MRPTVGKLMKPVTPNSAISANHFGQTVRGSWAQKPAMMGVSLTCAQTSPAYSATMSWLRPTGISPSSEPPP